MDHTGEKMVLRLESRFDYISKIEKKKTTNNNYLQMTTV